MGGCLSLVSVVGCQIEISVSSWSPVQRSPTDCGVSQCDREASILRRPWPTTTVEPLEKQYIYIYIYIYIHTHIYTKLISFVYSASLKLVGCNPWEICDLKAILYAQHAGICKPSVRSTRHTSVSTSYRHRTEARRKHSHGHHIAAFYKNITSTQFAYFLKKISPQGTNGPDTVQVVSHRHITADNWVRSQSNPCGCCDRQSGTGPGFCPSTSVFPCEYHSTNTREWFMPLSPTLYNLSNWQRR
jgi:hypothetical protein